MIPERQTERKRERDNVFMTYGLRIDSKDDEKRKFYRQKDKEAKVDLNFAWKIRVFGRVARWFVFKQKIPIWVNFGRP
jgi:hypothetical protein